MKNKICIGITTYQRPALLRKAIASIAKQHIPPHSELIFVMADNLPSKPDNKNIFDESSLPFATHYVAVAQQGISHARNACVECANAENCTHILFVDDDMELPDDYLCNLLAFMQHKNADAVRGKMRIIGDDNQPHALRRASFFDKQDLLPTSGVLIHQKIFADWQMRFDPKYICAMEDADFFYRAYLRGAKLYNAEHLYFNENRPDGRGIITKNKELIIMQGMKYKTSLRRHIGGFWRGLWFVVRRGVPLMLQIVGDILLLPFAPKKRGYKMVIRMMRIAGLVSGLWMKEVPGTAEAVAVEKYYL